MTATFCVVPFDRSRIGCAAGHRLQTEPFGHLVGPAPRLGERQTADPAEPAEVLGGRVPQIRREPLGHVADDSRPSLDPPAVGSVMPARSRSSVLLPLPLLPVS